MKKIGILGGTFNPIHTGHLLLAEGLKEKLDLDLVLFIPCFLPPHKKGIQLADCQDRIKMVRLAVKGNPYFKVSDIEIKRGGKSYSIDTIQDLRKKYKYDAKFFFIIGSDSLSGIKSWKYIDKLIKLCNLVTARRPGYNLTYSNVKLVDIPTLLISSTEIRHLVKQGKSIRYLVPGSVRKYIFKKRLYR